MKTFRRNAVIVTVLLFAAAAVYLNWSYGKKEAQTDLSRAEQPPTAEAAEATAAEPMEDTTGLYFEPEDASPAFFDEARLEKTRARDEAKAALTAVTETEGASQEMIDEALRKLTVMADRTQLESELETLLRARGFDECVVYLSDEGATVTVQPETPEGLSAAAAARITDVVTEKTGLTARELHIVEIK
ncbi:MAG: SpoIIIAH-like family protein [Oscillospiraceae bacterium]|nr:SpoIIIAH-like family protein [Oscillospiraceae bacterium]